MIEKLSNVLKENGDRQIAIGAENYLRNQFKLYGIKAPVRKLLFNPFIREWSKLEINKIIEITNLCWLHEYRDLQYFAIAILVKNVKSLNKEHLPTIENYITEKSWWDTVDGLSPWIVGTMFKNDPTLIEPNIDKWINSRNIWLQRSAILFQLKFKQKTNADLLFTIIKKLKESNEFFIRKAIGWSLREFAKTNPTLVLQFVNDTDLPSLSRKEALKHFNN